MKLETQHKASINGFEVEYGRFANGELFLKGAEFIIVRRIWNEIILLMKFWFYIKFISKEKDKVL